MHDVGIIFDGEFFRRRDGADFGDTADVVAAQVQQHQMFSQFLRIAKQVFGQGFIFSGRGTALTGTGKGAQGDAAIADTHQNLGAGADHLKIAEIQIEQIRRRVEPPQ